MGTQISLYMLAFSSQERLNSMSELKIEWKQATTYSKRTKMWSGTHLCRLSGNLLYSLSRQRVCEDDSPLELDCSLDQPLTSSVSLESTDLAHRLDRTSGLVSYGIIFIRVWWAFERVVSHNEVKTEISYLDRGAAYLYYLALVFGLHLYISLRSHSRMR